jgi:hypothetical protein
MTELERIATVIAIRAPTRQPQSSRHAYVSWELIALLRTELEKQGVDWRKLRKRTNEIAKQRAAQTSLAVPRR